MANGYDDTNRGVLFRNDRKERDAQPDMTGKVDIEGKEYRLAGWTKEAKTGKKFLSIAVTPSEEQSAAPAQAAQDPDDEIPF